MLGICNGFQALIKLGLVPYGDIVDATPDAPHADVQHHRPPPELLVRTRMASNLSPWLSQCELDDSTPSPSATARAALSPMTKCSPS